MKKIISIALVCIMLLYVGSVVIQADESQYPIVPQLEKYLVEDINHYFVPQGYDIRFSGLNIKDQENVYSTQVERDSEDKIVVPPIVTYSYTEDTVFSTLFYFKALEFSKAIEENYKFTPEMLRTFCLGNESAIRSFVAPWTLYNGKTGELYTWPEIMAMSESELLALDFKTPDFEKFITNLKQELEARNWWKEEYQERYNILYSHKDDYKNTLDEKENFVIDGVTYNFATLYYEFNNSKSKLHNNITCVNIFDDEFKVIYKNTSSLIREKYNEMFAAIDSAYSCKGARDYYDVAYQMMYDDVVIDSLESLSEEEKTQLKEECLPLFVALDKYGVEKEELKRAIAEFNYSVSVSYAVFGDDYITALFETEDNWEAINIVKTELGIIVNKDEYLLLNIGAIGEYKNDDTFYNLTDRFKDIDKIIEQIKSYCNTNYIDIKLFEKGIAYLESLLDSNPPATGENTVLYLAVACAAVVAMTAVVVRRKREAVA